MRLLRHCSKLLITVLNVALLRLHGLKKYTNISEASSVSSYALVQVEKIGQYIRLRNKKEKAGEIAKEEEVVNSVMRKKSEHETQA